MAHSTPHPTLLTYKPSIVYLCLGRVFALFIAKIEKYVMASNKCELYDADINTPEPEQAPTKFNAMGKVDRTICGTRAVDLAKSCGRFWFSVRTENSDLIPIPSYSSRILFSFSLSHSYHEASFDAFSSSYSISS